MISLALVAHSFCLEKAVFLVPLTEAQSGPKARKGWANIPSLVFLVLLLYVCAFEIFGMYFLKSRKMRRCYLHCAKHSLCCTDLVRFKFNNE